MVYTMTDGNSYGCCNLRVIIVVAGGFLVHFAIGGSYVLGNFGTYFISYLRNRTDDTSVRNVDTLWVSTFGAVGNMFGLSIGGLLAYRFGPRIAIFIGTVIFSTSVAVCFFAVNVSYVLVVVCYGFGTHGGAGIGYGTSIQSAIKWLPTNPTLAAGLIASGTGLSSVVFNPLITWYVNPDNLLPDYTDTDDEKYFTQEDLLDRVPFCFVILGATYFVLQFIGILCISDPSEDTAAVSVIKVTKNIGEKQTLLPNKPKQTNKPHKYKAGRDESVGGVENSMFTSYASTASGFDADSFTTDTDYSSVDQSMAKTATTDVDKVMNGTSGAAGMSKEEEDIMRTSEIAKTVSNKSIKSSNDLSIGGAIKLAFTSRSFYIIWLTIFLVPAGMQFFVVLYKAYGQTFIFDDHFLTWVGSIAAVFNCIGRPIWGVMMDFAGFKITLGCISFGFATITGTIFLTEEVPRAWFMVWICTIYLFYSGLWAIIPSALAKLLGTKHMAINYGLAASGLCLATLMGSTLATTLKTEIGWHGLFFLSSGMSGAVLVLSLFFNGVSRDGKKI